MPNKSGNKLVKGPMPGRQSNIVSFPLPDSGGADGQQLTSDPNQKQQRSNKPRPGSAGEKPQTGEYFGTP